MSHVCPGLRGVTATSTRVAAGAAGGPGACPPNNFG